MLVTRSDKPVFKVGVTSSSLLPYLGFAASDGSGSDRTRLLVPAQDFGHAAVGDAELSGNDARPDPVVGHLHDLVADVVGQRSAVDEDSSELVDSALTQRGGHCVQSQHPQSKRVNHHWGAIKVSRGRVNMQTRAAEADRVKHTHN